MELQQVRYFLATCETLNFTRAAEACNVTQPALTKSIKLLELELGGDLFDRQARPMRLTDLGAHLMEKFKALHELKTDISARAKLFSNLDNSAHTFGIVSTIGSHAFLPLAETLQRSVPGIAISLYLVPQMTLEDRLRAGEIELALIVEACLPPDRFSVTPLYEEGYGLTLPSEHPLLKKDKIVLSDLNNINYIHRIHCELNDHVETILAATNISWNRCLSTDQDAIALKMIEAGLGVSIMPKSLIRESHNVRDISDLPLKRTIALAHLNSRTLSPPAQLIKDMVIKQAGTFYGA